MKKCILFLLVCTFLFAVVPVQAEPIADVGDQLSAEELLAAEEPVYDFKEFVWGDSMDKVISVEGEPLANGEVDGMDAVYIVYETRAVGLDMLLAYYFCDEGLFSVRYLLTESHSNEELYIDDYNTFKAALTKKYGEPLLDSESWLNDSKKEYYSDNKGDALCYGYLTYYTWYLTERTWISMNMDADNYDITMRIDYESMTITPGEADYSDEI